MGHDFSIRKMAYAMFEYEGYMPGTLSFKNRNPGNLVYAHQPGAVPDEKSYAVFPSFEDGWRALLTQLRIAFDNTSIHYNDHMTLLEFYQKYAPRRTDSPLNYAIFVASRFKGGVTINTRLKDLP